MQHELCPNETFLLNPSFALLWTAIMKFSSELTLCFVFLSALTTQAAIITTGDVDPIDPSVWAAGTVVVGHVGETSEGALTINDGSSVSVVASVRLGEYAGAMGTLNVSGAGSTLTNNWRDLYVGWSGTGKLNITDGGTVNTSYSGYIGYQGGSSGKATVSGVGSTWNITSPYEPSTIHGSLHVGAGGNGQLSIADGGRVNVEAFLLIDQLENGESFINMSSGGMLALKGEVDDSIDDFFSIVEGTDAIRWWDTSAGDWAILNTATINTDYTLEYLTSGDLTGYTLLTVMAAGPVSGDANGDGKVDGSDVTVLAGNWQVGVNDGQTATWLMGDFNSDGRVDGSDVTILAGNWQHNVTSTATAVPEPGIATLLFAILLAMGLIQVGRVATR